MKKTFEFIKENKYILAIFLIIFIVLVYCHLNTFVVNDDLAYSFFKRLNERVTNLYQVIWIILDIIEVLMDDFLFIV